MPNTKTHKVYNFRNAIFTGFIIISLLSTASTFTVSYLLMKQHAEQQNKIQMQSLTDALMSSLDYAVSHEEVQTRDIPRVLSGKILEIADINKHDIYLFDTQGNYIFSNKHNTEIHPPSIPKSIVQKIMKEDKRIDITSYDEKLSSNLTSSYMVLKNNMLEPIAIVYFPFYHSDANYQALFKSFLINTLWVNLIIVGLSLALGWYISNRLTHALKDFSKVINDLTLFDKEPKILKNYKNNDLKTLADAYNTLVMRIKDQMETLSYSAKEGAWREMARQVAHEVKNPLTPMKLNIQMYQRKFDPKDPQLREKTDKLLNMLISQIDLIAEVATAFSKFVQLPEKNNEHLYLNEEIPAILDVFGTDDILFSAGEDPIYMDMDRIFLTRILTNLITNAKQAESPDRNLKIWVSLEKINRKLLLRIRDNGTGISPDKAENIFQPNFTTKGTGMGLGLTMVKKMVEDYHGEISVEPNPGKGAEFTISFPHNA